MIRLLHCRRLRRQTFQHTAGAGDVSERQSLERLLVVRSPLLVRSEGARKKRNMCRLRLSALKSSPSSCRGDGSDTFAGLCDVQEHAKRCLDANDDRHFNLLMSRRHKPSRLWSFKLPTAPRSPFRMTSQTLNSFVALARARVQQPLSCLSAWCRFRAPPACS